MATFKRRVGTSGISGHLYETKLLSLLHTRLMRDVNRKQTAPQNMDFQLASNMHDVGSFDDICLRVTQGDHRLLAFIQAKHKDTKDKLVYDLIENAYISWMKVAPKLSVANKDVFFNSEFNNIECLFILYTNAKYLDDAPTSQAGCRWKPYCGKFATQLNSWICTYDQGYQPDYTSQQVHIARDIVLKHELTALAYHFVEFLKTAHPSLDMKDDYIEKYHVLLGKYVVKLDLISKERCRALKFRKEFFDTTNSTTAMLRQNIYDVILKDQVSINRTKEQGKRKKPTSAELKEKQNKINDLISSLFSKPTVTTLAKLIEKKIITTRADTSSKLEFNVEVSPDDVKKLDTINMTSANIQEAKETAARNMLATLELKVPLTFGNVDVALRGNAKNRAKYLCDTILSLYANSRQEGDTRILTIDEKVDEGFTKLNGGITSAVGNLLIQDDHTKLLQFTQNHKTLAENAKCLFKELNKSLKVKQIEAIRFDVKCCSLPKLTFDYTSEAEFILNKIVVYDRQMNHEDLEKKLTEELHNLCQDYDKPYFEIHPHTLFEMYHREIQKWWMTREPVVPYLTKTTDIYVQLKADVIMEPVMSKLQYTFDNNNMDYYAFKFNSNSVDALQLSEESSTIIISDITTLTTIKVMEYLKNHFVNKTYAVIDLVCVYKQTEEDFKKLLVEVSHTKKCIIVVCNETKNVQTYFTYFKRLSAFREVVSNRSVIIVTDVKSSHDVRECFSSALLHTDDKLSLMDLTAASQTSLKDNAQIIFQGERVNLEVLLDDDKCAAVVKQRVLDRLIRGEDISLGQPLANAKYEKLKHFYIERKISRQIDHRTKYESQNYVRTFDDVADDVVLLTAPPGMGKSTLLTHLSVQTNKQTHKASRWIVRIDLIDHSKVFHDWYNERTDIDIDLAYDFISQFILRKENSSQESHSSFVLDMFRMFYESGRLVLLFDGFDEICPNYKHTVIKFFDVVKTFPQKTKMWVSSRPYTDILPELETSLGTAYRMAFLTKADQAEYLAKVWQHKFANNDLSEVQKNNLKVILNYIVTDLNSIAEFRYIFKSCYDYLMQYFLHRDATFIKDIMVLYEKFAELCDNCVNYIIVPKDFGHTPEIIVECPLFLYLATNYVFSLIFGAKLIADNLKLDVNRRTIYEIFIEVKIKKILMEEKNKMSPFILDNARIIENDYINCLNAHKKIATQWFFIDIVKNKSYLDDYDEDIYLRFLQELSLLDEYENMMKKIKSGQDKTGLISYVGSDNRPVFLHKTILEYLDAEYIFDKFVIPDSDYWKLYYTNACAGNDMWLHYRIRVDETLRNVWTSKIKPWASATEYFAEIMDIINSRTDEYERSALHHFVANLSPLDFESNFCFRKYEDDYYRNLVQNRETNRSECEKVAKEIISYMKPEVKNELEGYWNDKQDQSVNFAVAYHRHMRARTGFRSNMELIAGSED